MHNSNNIHGLIREKYIFVPHKDIKMVSRDILNVFWIVCLLWRQVSSLIAWLTQSPGVPGSNPAAADIFPWCTHIQ